ncbi:33 kDa chaperonin [mine drainage metagenome]|uniref:33 kDa chaperonin n=1 Tax=mine drainage metagenome TaxID=410659 RepID=A0A1J5QP43_9ZZZZ
MNTDSLTRFLFENAAIRGEIVHLDATWQSVLNKHDYPPVLRRAMGELMAAAALLAATLKLQGALVLQIQGTGPVSLLVVECTGDLAMRATAKWNGELAQGSLLDMIADGRFVITLDPKDGKQAYQGIVPLEGTSVAEILQNYMIRSEQLETRLVLAADDGRAAGMLLQKLPQRVDEDADAWGRSDQLAATLGAQELLELPATEILHRLFHQEDIRLFDPTPVSFHCSCSRARVAAMLRMLGPDEINGVIAERGEMEVHCEFCNQRYAFDRIDVEQVFASGTPAPGGDSRH